MPSTCLGLIHIRPYPVHHSISISWNDNRWSPNEFEARALSQCWRKRPMPTQWPCVDMILNVYAILPFSWQVSLANGSTLHSPESPRWFWQLLKHGMLSYESTWRGKPPSWCPNTHGNKVPGGDRSPHCRHTWNLIWRKHSQNIIPKHRHWVASIKKLNA